MNSDSYGHDFFKMIVDNSMDVIYILDFNEKFVYISPSVNATFGYTQNEIIGKKIQNFLLPKSYEKQMLGLKKVMKEKKFDASEKLTLQMFKKDGSKVWVEAHARFLIGDDGAPKGILGVARDVSDRVRIEADLIKRVRELKKQ